MSSTRSPELGSALNLVATHLAAEVERAPLLGLSAAVVCGGEMLWSGGFGHVDRAKGVPIQADTAFRVASITKVVTATAIMQLRDAGKLRLDDPLVQHIPEFEVGVPFDDCPTILLRHVLSHVSGLQREPYLDHWVTLRAPTAQEMLAHLRDQEVLYPPLTEVHYSNLGFALLGEVIRRVTGGSYADYVREHVFLPLDMQRSGYEASAYEATRLAQGYYSAEDSEPVPQWSLEGFRPAGGLYSTADDLAKFIGFQIAGDRRVLADSTRREMHLPVFRDEKTGNGFGVGWAIGDVDGKRTVGHGGALQGYRSQCLVAPEARVGVVVLVNCSHEPSRLCRRILELLLPFTDLIADRGDSTGAKCEATADWHDLVGAYEWRSFTKIRVGIAAGRLVYHTGEHPAPDSPELLPAEGGGFRVRRGADNGERAWFERDAAGDIVRLWIGSGPYDRCS